jgi:hypothetical protein
MQMQAFAAERAGAQISVLRADCRRLCHSPTAAQIGGSARVPLTSFPFSVLLTIDSSWAADQGFADSSTLSTARPRCGRTRA